MRTRAESRGAKVGEIFNLARYAHELRRANLNAEDESVKSEIENLAYVARPLVAHFSSARAIQILPQGTTHYPALFPKKQ